MSWPVFALGDVLEIARGGSPRPIEKYLTDEPDGLNWISISDATSSGKIINKTARKIKKEGLAKSRWVEPGDFLLSNSMSFGRPYIMGTTGCIHDGWLVLKPGRKDVNPDYLYHLLGSEPIFAQFAKRATGTTVKNLNSQIVSETRIPLPPLPEQQRIAAILDQADEVRRLRRKALARLSDLGHAIFLEMFGDPSGNPMGWPLGTIRDLLTEAKYGTAQKANTDGKGLPILRMGNVTYDGQIDLSDLKHVELSAKDFPKYTTRPGDLLFNRTNSKELVGKTAVIETSEPMAIAGYLVRARTNKRGNPHYISAYLNSAHGKAVLRSMCNNIVGMANINAQDMQDIVIALPPVELQNQFAARLSAISDQRKVFEVAARKSDALFASLQHRAFRGEL